MKYFALLIFSASALLADVTGKWTGTLTRDDGGEGGTALLILKQEGSKLTGTAGPSDGAQHQIENGKIEGQDLAFEVKTGSSVMKFALKQVGDEIKGDVSRELDGQKQTAKLAVKREK